MNPGKDRKPEPQLGQDSKDAKDPQKQQQQTGTGQQYGEGSYSGTRQYNEGVKEHMQHHDVEREAREAAPRTAAEEKERREAERAGRARSRGEGSPDSPDSPDEGKGA
jgi:hypothetical protein